MCVGTRRHGCRVPILRRGRLVRRARGRSKKQACRMSHNVPRFQVLSIDGVPVTHMTRLDCVRRLKESQLVIKLMVRCRGALRPEVVSAEKKNTPERSKVPPELPSVPPPVPPRKLRQARGLADGEANPSPVKKSWSGSSSRSSSQNGSPSSQPANQPDSKSTSYESCESSPRSNGSVVQESPKGSIVKERSPELAKSKQVSLTGCRTRVIFSFEMQPPFCPPAGTSRGDGVRGRQVPVRLDARKHVGRHGQLDVDGDRPILHYLGPSIHHFHRLDCIHRLRTTGRAILASGPRLRGSVLGPRLATVQSDLSVREPVRRLPIVQLDPRLSAPSSG